MEQFLHNLPIFHGVEISEIKSLLVFLTAQRKSYKKGEIILSEGETTDCIGVVAIYGAITVWWAVYAPAAPSQRRMSAFRMSR